MSVHHRWVWCVCICSHDMVEVSLVPGIHGWQKERLVSDFCACVKLTIVIAPLFRIMTQPYLLFSIKTSSRSTTEEKVKQSPHVHLSMASSHCILHLCRLCIRPRLMRTHRHCPCKWPYVEEYQNNTVMHNPYAEECQNNMVSQISGKILRMRKQLKPGVLSAVCEHQV